MKKWPEGLRRIGKEEFTARLTADLRDKAPEQEQERSYASWGDMAEQPQAEQPGNRLSRW